MNVTLHKVARKVSNPSGTKTDVSLITGNVNVGDSKKSVVWILI